MAAGFDGIAVYDNYVAPSTWPTIASWRAPADLLFSFNEWHEGHQFEPMKSRSDLTQAELELRYHNVDDGSYRLRGLRQVLDLVL